MVYHERRYGKGLAIIYTTYRRCGSMAQAQIISTLRHYNAPPNHVPHLGSCMPAQYTLLRIMPCEGGFVPMWQLLPVWQLLRRFCSNQYAGANHLHMYMHTQNCPWPWEWCRQFWRLLGHPDRPRCCPGPRRDAQSPRPQGIRGVSPCNTADVWSTSSNGALCGHLVSSNCRCQQLIVKTWRVG